MGAPNRTHLLHLTGRLLAAFLYLLAFRAPAQQPTQATTVPLILPGGLAYDSAGNLYFAETGKHVIRRVTPTGILTTVAGTATQGFAGDGGQATSAELDSPSAVALDAGGNLFLADAHNHRIRRVDAVTGLISTYAGTGAAGLSPDGTLASAALLDLPSALAFDTAQNLFFADQRTHVIRRIDHATGQLATVAGNGTQGYSGDNGPATSAAIDSPSGLALDAAGNLFLADTHNQRVRRVDASTGIITSVAGTGQPGFSGDNASAATAAIRLPRGLALDSSGNLFLVDSSNHRIRRIDASTGQIATIAGDGTQAYAGDGSPAATASLDMPQALTLSPASLPTLADTANQRVRQVDSSAIIHTIAGLGATTAGSLTLTGPTVTLYGTGSVTATLAASAATGSVTFFDGGQTLATVALSSNSAPFSTATLSAGQHSLSATYPGDTLHSAAQSGVMNISIAPAPLIAIPNSVALLYGQSIPTLTGMLSGVLARDASLVNLALTTSAVPTSPPAAYPIVAALTGPAAGNYTLTQASAAVTITQAAATVSLSNALAVHVASTTSGTPTGTVKLFDAATLYASATLSPTGDVTFSSANLSAGTHTLTAVYAGDTDFLTATSAPVVLTLGATPTADFALIATGQTSVTVPAGNPAAFSFSVTPLNGALSSPIQLTVSGLPTGATASFNPAYLPPANTPAAFILTIQTPKTASLHPLEDHRSPLIFAALLPLLLLRKRRLRLPLLAALLTLTLGCGARVNTSEAASPGVSYNLTVLATATSATGATLQHTAAVVLTLQP